MVSHGNVREVPADLWAGLIDRTPIVFQENAVMLLALEYPRSGTVGIGFGIGLEDVLRSLMQMRRDSFDLGLAYRDHNIAATIRTRSAIDVVLNLDCENLKLFSPEVMRGQEPAKCKILLLF